MGGAVRACEIKWLPARIKVSAPRPYIENAQEGFGGSSAARLARAYSQYPLEQSLPKAAT